MLRRPGRARFTSLLAVAASALAPSPALAAQVERVENVQVVQRLTGPSITSGVAVGGTDLGHMVVHNEKTYFLFGDTFSGNTPDDGGFWRSNVMAYTTEVDPTNGIALDGWITNANGHAREVIASGRTSPITEIPTGAVSANGSIYAWYMAVNWWGPAGQWTNNYAGLARWQEGQPRFSVIEDFEFPADSNFGMVAASFRDQPTAQDDDYLYLWGTPAGRLGGVKLARVDPLHIENHAAYQYFGGLQAGAPTWVSSEYDAPLIVPPTVGEMSVMYNPALESWTMLSLNHNHYAIELRQADAPWGPWSDPVTVATGQQFPGLYGSYMNPLYVEDDGRTVYFTMSLWNPYDVYLAKATFITAEAPHTADFNNDGQVDGADLTRWRTEFGPSDRADANGDGVTDGADFLAWQQQLHISATSAAPEPTAATLAALAAGAMAYRRAAPRCKSTR